MCSSDNVFLLEASLLLSYAPSVAHPAPGLVKDPKLHCTTPAHIPSREFFLSNNHNSKRCRYNFNSFTIFSFFPPSLSIRDTLRASKNMYMCILRDAGSFDALTPSPSFPKYALREMGEHDLPSCRGRTCSFTWRLPTLTRYLTFLSPFTESSSSQVSQPI